MNRLLLGLFILLLTFEKYSTFKCEENLTIQQPDDASNETKTVYYPSNTTTPQTYDAGQLCNWTVIVKPGYYAFLSITTTTPPLNNTLLVIDSIQKASIVNYADAEPFFLLGPSFTVMLNATVEGKLLFRINWAKFPDFNPQFYNVKSNGELIVLTSINLANATVITADTQVSLVAMYTEPLKLLYYLRTCMVFDGPTWNSTFLGNLYDALQSHQQLVSSGKQMTLYQVFEPGSQLGNPIIIQDYSNTRNFVQYDGIECLSSTFCPMALNAVNGTAAAVTISNSSRYLKILEFSKNSTLTVYNGALLDSNIIATYDSESSKRIPQQFNGIVTTFTLDSSSAIIELSEDSVNAKWSAPFDGRRGFIASKNVAILSTDQDISESFIGTDQYNFTTLIKNNGLIGSSSLRIYISSGENAVYDKTFLKTSNDIPQLLTVQGDSYKLDYKTNGENTTGVYVEFTMDKINSSPKFCAFFMILLATLGV